MGKNKVDHLNDNISHFIARTIVYANVATEGLPQVYCPKQQQNFTRVSICQAC